MLNSYHMDFFYAFWLHFPLSFRWLTNSPAGTWVSRLMICYERKRWGDGPAVTFLLWVWHTRLHFPHTSSTSLRVVDWLVKSKSEIAKCWWPYCSSWLNISVIKESVKQLLTELIRSRNSEASGSSSKWERVVIIMSTCKWGGVMECDLLVTVGGTFYQERDPC